jgi:signal transduction histidine kinase
LVSAELLGDELDQLDRQELAQLVGAIQRRARVLQILVDNLMQTARGQLNLDCQTFDVAALIADVLLTVEPLLAHNRHVCRSPERCAVW